MWPSGRYSGRAPVSRFSCGQPATRSKHQLPMRGTREILMNRRLVDVQDLVFEQQAAFWDNMQGILGRGGGLGMCFFVSELPESLLLGCRTWSLVGGAEIGFSGFVSLD